MEDEAQLVSADDGRQDDSACGPAPDGQARRRDRRRGQSQSRDLRVAAASGREPDREGRQRRSSDGDTLAVECTGPYRAWRWFGASIKTAKHQFEMRSRHVLKSNSMRFAAALLAALASFVAGPTAARPAAQQHHDQAPGFYRVKVGDLEVTALFDGTGAFDPHWLNGTNAPVPSNSAVTSRSPTFTR